MYAHGAWYVTVGIGDHFHVSSPFARRLLPIVIALAVIAGLAVGGYYVYQYAYCNDCSAQHGNDQRDLGAVVTSGYECAGIGRYVSISIHYH